MNHTEETKSSACGSKAFKWVGILASGAAGGITGLLTNNFVPWLVGGLAVGLILCFGIRGGG